MSRFFILRSGWSCIHHLNYRVQNSNVSISSLLNNSYMNEHISLPSVHFHLQPPAPLLSPPPPPFLTAVMRAIQIAWLLPIGPEDLHCLSSRSFQMHSKLGVAVFSEDLSFL